MQRSIKHRLKLPILAALAAVNGFGCSPMQNQIQLQGPAQSTILPSQFQGLSAQELARYYPISPGMQWQYKLKQTQDGQDNTRYHTMQITQEALPQDSATTTSASAILRRSYPESPQQPRPGLARRLSDRVELSHYQANPAEGLAPFATSLTGLPMPAALTSRAVAFSLHTKNGTTGFIVALKAPLTPGHAWPGRQFQGGTETLSVKTFETIETPAGSFDTLCVEHHIRYDNGREDFLRYWYAPQVGMVKMHEEITFYTDHWSKFVSTGILSGFQRP